MGSPTKSYIVKATIEQANKDSSDEMSRSRSRGNSSPRESLSGESTPPAGATTEELEKLRARRRYRKKLNGPGGVVNIWDVPEFMPGAKPRADPKERDAFERRSIAVFREQELANREQTIEFEIVEEERATAKMTDDIADLLAMFPKLESVVVRETYLQHRCNRAAATDELLVLAGLHEDDLPRATKSLNMSEFPRLSSQSAGTSLPDERIGSDEEFTRKLSYQAIVSKGRLHEP